MRNCPLGRVLVPVDESSTGSESATPITDQRNSAVEDRPTPASPNAAEDQSAAGTQP